jgi:hypothetical protein
VYVLPEPAAVVRIGQRRRDESLQHEAGHRFAGVVPHGDEYPVLRLDRSRSPTCSRSTLRPMAALAEFLDRQVAVVAISGQKTLEMLLLVRHRETESHLVVVRSELIAERRALDAVGAEPRPRLPLVRADRRAAHPDRILTRELERQRPSRRPAHPEIPVEPPALRIAQIGPQVHLVAFDPLDDDVPARKLVVDDRNRCCGLGRTLRRNQENAENREHSQPNGESSWRHIDLGLADDIGEDPNHTLRL